MDHQAAPTTLHRQVTHDLVARIQSGELAPGAPIPAEVDLCRTYGLSRATIRRAMETLVGMGLVTRRRGAGSFVAGRPQDLRQLQLTGFLDDSISYGLRILHDCAARADGRIAAALAVEPGTSVHRIQSLVHREAEIFTIADAFTPEHPGGQGVPDDYAEGTLSAQAMARRLGQRIARAEQELDAVAANRIDARYLGIPLHSPLMRARRVYFGLDGRPIQYLVVRYHPDRYRFLVDLLPRPGCAEVPPGKRFKKEPS